MRPRARSPAYIPAARPSSKSNRTTSANFGPDIAGNRVVYTNDLLGDDNIWEITFELCEHPRVVPPTFAEVEASASATAPFAVAGEMRLQQVFDAAAFPCPSTSRLINGMTLRAEARSLPAAWTVPDVEIRLSTTIRPPDLLSPLFSANVGLDQQLVYTGPLELATSAAGPPGGPLEFDLVIPFETAFPYDPSRGHLLVDVLLHAGDDPGGGFAFDAESSPGNETSQLVALSVGASTGVAVPGGLVARFSFGPVPQFVPALSPVMRGLLAAALLGGAAWQRRRMPQRSVCRTSSRP